MVGEYYSEATSDKYPAKSGGKPQCAISRGDYLATAKARLQLIVGSANLL
jgi:hypothetical protein